MNEIHLRSLNTFGMGRDLVKAEKFFFISFTLSSLFDLITDMPTTRRGRDTTKATEKRRSSFDIAMEIPMGKITRRRKRLELISGLSLWFSYEETHTGVQHFELRYEDLHSCHYVQDTLFARL
jgi:hypothetical protein